MLVPAPHDLDQRPGNALYDGSSRMEPIPGAMPQMQEETMAARKQTESICYNCGFQIVMDYPYVQPCPICGQQLIQRKPTAAPRGNKNSKGAKKEHGTD